jgi:hypothetical protein
LINKKQSYKEGKRGRQNGRKQRINLEAMNKNTKRNKQT